jgi:hypothetical protein
MKPVRGVKNFALLAAVTGLVSAMGLSTVPSPAHASVVMRVYSNNIENLVTNDDSDGNCTQHTGPELFRSMLVNDSGVSLANGGTGVAAPDAVILQQVRGKGQIDALADQLSALFGLPAGTYAAFVARDNPDSWGTNHGCLETSTQTLTEAEALAARKSVQTNGVIYDTRKLSLLSTSDYWSVGWYPGGSYPSACTMYKPPTANSSAGNLTNKWERTSAVEGRFKYIATGTTVTIATMHLPQENDEHPCGTTSGSKGIGSSGITVGDGATTKMLNSTVRIFGIDANREGLSPTVLNSTFGVTSHGTAATDSANYENGAKKKIDYLFTNTAVQSSPIDYTVQGTTSNHKAVYAFMSF